MTTTKEWIGTDVSLEISLHEYGLVIRPNENNDTAGNDEYFCLYKVADDAYDTGHIREGELDDMMQGNSWVNPCRYIKFYRIDVRRMAKNVNDPINCLTLYSITGMRM